MAKKPGRARPRKPRNSGYRLPAGVSIGGYKAGQFAPRHWWARATVKPAVQDRKREALLAGRIPDADATEYQLTPAGKHVTIFTYRYAGPEGEELLRRHLRLLPRDVLARVHISRGDTKSADWISRPYSHPTHAVAALEDWRSHPSAAVILAGDEDDWDEAEDDDAEENVRYELKVMQDGWGPARRRKDWQDYAERSEGTGKAAPKRKLRKAAKRKPARGTGKAKKRMPGVRRKRSKGMSKRDVRKQRKPARKKARPARSRVRRVRR